MKTVGYAQIDVRYGDVNANRAAIAEACAKADTADLLVLPELAISGYDFPDRAAVFDAAEPFEDGPTRAFLADIAGAFQLTLVCGYAERAAEGCYNSAMLVRPDGSAENYRKVHLFNREMDLFLPGGAPPPVCETPAGRVGLMICFDWFFPETARSLALRGAQIIAHPSNLVLPWCQRAMFARSVENAVFSVTANRIGTETQAGRTLTFTGGSQILGTHGETLSEAPVDAPYAGTAAIDPSEADDKTIAERNDRFRDRRPALYDPL